MAITGIYYLDGPSLASSTAVYDDADLTTCAADGWYSDGLISRQQVDCVLLAEVSCDAPIPYLYITDVVTDTGAGTTTYKLHVEVADFVGFMNLKGERGDNTKSASVDNTIGALYSVDLSVSNAQPAFTEVFNSTAVIIPIGVYDCTMNASGAPIVVGSVEVNGGVSFGLSTDYYTYVAQTVVSYLA